ncbi:MAG: hypothetical protein HC850_18510 [Rhodomicrobium sp.]|nr:hypothetical protein [Rhodomicrobium sp.]
MEEADVEAVFFVSGSNQMLAMQRLHGSHALTRNPHKLHLFFDGFTVNSAKTGYADPR